MPSTYKTPGVYVEEVSTFPPSVAPVATAIPAFIGYTEQAIKNGEPITNIPTRVSSFVEFLQYFGGAPDRGIIIRLNALNQFVKSEVQNNVQQYYLYDCLRLFYDNGGGDCYIVSVGNYTETPEIGAAIPASGILGGLKALEKFDEPTMIVSPDATLLSGTNMYSYQQQAMAQCANLQDRFFIGDLLKNDENVSGETFDERVSQIRDRIGINNLKYGALYAPWLKASLSANLQFRDVLFADESTAAGSVTAASSRGVLFGMTQDQAIRNIIFDVESASDISSTLESLIDPNDGSNILDGASSLEGALKSLNDAVSSLLAGFAGTYADVQTDGNLPDLYAKLLAIIADIQGVYSGLTASGSTGDFKLQGDIDDMLAEITSCFTALATHHQMIDSESSSALTLMTASSDFTDAVALLGLGAANPAAVTPNQDTLNEYFTQAAVDALITYINGDLVTAITSGGDGTGATALSTIETELPANLADEINTELQTLLDASPATIAALDGSITGSATLSDAAIAAASAYVTAYDDPPASLAIGDVQANVLSRVNSYIEDTLSAANTAVQAGGDEAAVIAAIAITATPVNDNLNIAATGAQSAISKVAGFFSDVLEAAQSYESTFDSSLKDVFGNYKTLLDRAEQDIMVLPPSAAIAGIYTKVDNERGVWKAPANVSLSSVSGPYVNINAAEQEDLNVDVNAGKSINAIRAFTGKGILVWGARTLAGNDNEWRYVPVRRFFNFAEESIKKATEQFVFEPNDANTWVRVRAMIENFLILQWRAGALAGAKPEQAFFVKIGLGETMTALDILEGRMIVEIGMAVVRPAEFIILRFSHKMQES